MNIITNNQRKKHLLSIYYVLKILSAMHFYLIYLFVMKVYNP